MKRLNKAQWKTIYDAMNECDGEAQELIQAIETFNLNLDTQRNELQGLVDAYNEKLQALKSVYENLGSQAQDYYDERSEKWQEGDAGTQYAEWIQQLESPDGLDDIEINLPADIEEPDIPDFSDTEWLPPEAPGEE